MNDSEGGSSSYRPQEHLTENNDDPGPLRLNLRACEAMLLFYR